MINKRKAFFVLHRQVFRRALVQAEIPGAPVWKMVRTAALTEEEMRGKLEPWLSKLVKFAHGLEDAQDQLLERLPRKVDALKKIYPHYEKMVADWDVNRIASIVEAYGDVGMELIEISNDLQEVFGHRSTYANYLKQIAPSIIKLSEDDTIKILFSEAVASLHADEAVV